MTALQHPTLPAYRQYRLTPQFGTREPEQPFSEKPHPHMGLQPLELADWIKIDDQFEAELGLKRLLAAREPDQVFAALPGSEAAGQETLQLLGEHLTAQFPEHYRREEDQWVNRKTGERWPVAPTTDHPLKIAGRMIQEDLCLMSQQGADPQYRLSAASLFFPSRWRLREKLGQTMSGIHQPVPDYRQIENPADLFLQRMKTEKPMARSNWSIHDTPELFQPVAPPADPQAGPITEENAGRRLWIRNEWQTLRRLPTTRDVLFTIKTTLHPLERLVQQPGVAQRLAQVIRMMPPELIQYKSNTGFKEAMLAYLDRQAARENG
jgi:hypothetical protein